jgi:hypothetical protein
MTQTEALRLALEALEYAGPSWIESRQPAITAIKAALEAKDEPVKLRRGDILRCNESDELCTVWATSTSGKTLVKWKDNDFGNYTAEQIGELFWIEPKEEDEPWEKFCDSNCVWTDHHPNCKLEQPEHGWTPKRIAGMARLKEAQDKKLSQHKWIGLKDEDKSLFSSWLDHKTDDEVFTAIEAKLKEKNT